MLNLIICLINFYCNAQCDEKAAYKQFKNDLKAIEFCTKNPKSNHKDMPLLIERLEKITLIESEEDINFFGCLGANENDIQKWKKWLKRNKRKFCWDESKSEYYLND